MSHKVIKEWRATPQISLLIYNTNDPYIRMPWNVYTLCVRKGIVDGDCQYLDVLSLYLDTDKSLSEANIDNLTTLTNEVMNLSIKIMTENDWDVREEYAQKIQTMVRVMSNSNIFGEDVTTVCLVDEVALMNLNLYPKAFHPLKLKCN